MNDVDFGFLERKPPLSFGNVTFVGYGVPVEDDEFRPGATHIIFMGPKATPQWARDYALQYHSKRESDER